MVRCTLLSLKMMLMAVGEDRVVVVSAAPTSLVVPKINKIKVLFATEMAQALGPVKPDTWAWPEGFRASGLQAQPIRH